MQKPKSVSMSVPSTSGGMKDEKWCYPVYDKETKSFAIQDKSREYLLGVHGSRNTKTLRQNHPVHWKLIHV